MPNSKAMKLSSTYPTVEDNISTQENIHCSIIIEGTKHKEKNCNYCLRTMCQKCFGQQELFSSNENQNIQCRNCQENRSFKTTMICSFLNTLQLIIFLVAFPIFGLALAQQKTEKVILKIERKIDNICLILLVNIFFSLPIYLGCFLVQLFLAPLKIIYGFRQAMEFRTINVSKYIFSQQQ